MTCKDCIHYNICLDNGDDAAKQNAPNAEKECDDFENKADFVEVVRCKDCNFYEPLKHPSKSWRGKALYCCRSAVKKVNPDDYCSHGERKQKNDFEEE